MNAVPSSSEASAPRTGSSPARLHGGFGVPAPPRAQEDSQHVACQGENAVARLGRAPAVAGRCLRAVIESPPEHGADAETPQGGDYGVGGHVVTTVRVEEVRDPSGIAGTREERSCSGSSSVSQSADAQRTYIIKGHCWTLLVYWTYGYVC